MAQISFRITRVAKGIDMLIVVTWMEIAVSVVFVVAALLAMMVVRGISQNQDDLHGELHGGVNPGIDVALIYLLIFSTSHEISIFFKSLISDRR